MAKVVKMKWGQEPPPGSVYIGRGCASIWGNPYHIGRDISREKALLLFEAYARERLKREPTWLDPLIGKDLCCWCYPLACHGDILLALIDEIQKEV